MRAVPTGRGATIRAAVCRGVGLPPSIEDLHLDAPVLEDQGVEDDQVRAWSGQGPMGVRQGAGLETRRTLTRVEISPKKHVGGAPGRPVALNVAAHFSDGTSRDETRWTVFQAEDSSAVKRTQLPKAQ